jgi:hypothetical protein
MSLCVCRCRCLSCRWTTIPTIWREATGATGSAIPTLQRPTAPGSTPIWPLLTLDYSTFCSLVILILYSPHWVRYSDATAPHRSWLHANLSAFDTRLLDILLSGNFYFYAPIGSAIQMLQRAPGSTPICPLYYSTIFSLW